MKQYKIVIISMVIGLGIISFIFWFFFAVISYRRPNYSYEVIGGYCSRDNFDLYYKNDNVRYYSACYKKINLVEERFIFNFKRDLKEVIREGEFLNILQKADIYKWAFPGGIQMDYYVDDYSDSTNLIVSKCSLKNRTDYYIYNGQDSNLCRYLYQGWEYYED